MSQRLPVNFVHPSFISIICSLIFLQSYRFVGKIAGKDWSKLVQSDERQKSEKGKIRTHAAFGFSLFAFN